MQLKSGGVAITAGRLDPRKGRQCLWFVKGDVYEWFFPEECLRQAQEDGAQPAKLALDYSRLSPQEYAQLLALIEKATPKDADVQEDGP